MNPRYFYILVFCFLSLVSVSRAQFVTVDGKRIVDPEGETILLKGTNLGNWLVPEGYMFKMHEVNSPHKIHTLLSEMIGPEETGKFWDSYLDRYIQEHDIQYLKNLGLNHLRLPFHYKLLTDEDYLGRNYHGFVYFDRAVEWCRKAGLYLLFDMHCAPCGQTGDNIDDSDGYPYLFESPMCQEQIIDIWRRIAERYKDEPIVFGYDLMNEPIAHYFEADFARLNPELPALYKRIVAAIREVDTNHLVFLNGAQWSTNFDVFGPPFDDKLVYEFHKYWFEVKHEAIQEYIDFSERHNVPIYIGETGENTDEWVKSFRILLEQNQIGWCFWPYKKMNNTSGIMNFNEPGTYHFITEYAKSDRRSYKAIRENRPPKQEVLNALTGFLENCLHAQNFANAGYIEALGLSAREPK
jgi:hypothetical protein